MTDYLTKLASRALGVALTAQPVVPSIFAAERPLAEAASGVWSEQHRQDGLDLEVPGWSPIPSQAVRRAPSRSAAPPAATPDPSAENTASPPSPGPAVASSQTGAGPAGSQGPTGLVDAGGAAPWERIDVSPSPVLPAEPDAHSPHGLLVQPFGQESERRPATPAREHTMPDHGGQASPAVTLAGPGVVRQHADDTGRPNAAPAISPPAPLAGAPRTPALTPNARATQQPLHAPPGDSSGLFPLEPSEVETRPALSAQPTATQGSLPAIRQASEAPPDRFTVTRRLRMAEAGFADSGQNADAGGDSNGSGLLLPAESEQGPRRSPDARAHRLVLEQPTSPPTPAPIIEVTIGRVEIRAVQAARPATKPKAAPSAPALSLEAYLSQQQGSKP